MAGPRVAVVGSGVAGAGTAFALAAGGAEVVVVDSVLPGQATAAGAGIIQPWSSTATGPAYELYAAGAAYYPTLIERLAEVGVADIGYRVTGSLVAQADAARLDEVEERLRRRTAGVAVAGTVERLGERDARALFPPLAPELGAVYVSGGARVDGRMLRAGLLAGARRLGAVVVDAPARLVPAHTGTCAVHTPGGDVGADVVVVAAGAWVNSVVEPLGYRSPSSRSAGRSLTSSSRTARPLTGPRSCRSPATTSSRSTPAGSWWARPGRPAAASTRGSPPAGCRRC